MRTRRSLSLAGLLAAAALLAGCGSSDAPCVLIVTLDTTRADAVGFSGGPERVTPVLDALAAESVVFERARTVAPITLPAHSSMLTGLYPPRHGVRLNGTQALPESATTLAERARDAGYETAAFVAAAVLDRNFGLAQGFETYGAPLRPQSDAGPHFPERPAAEVVDEALAWLEDGWNRRRPFLLWVHLFDPHNPYEPDSRFYLQAGLDSYLGEVAAADHAVGRLLDDLRERGVLDRTCVVVVGDHGEGLEEHDEATHGALCFETTVRVPMLVRFPGGHRAGERSTATVSVVDLYPTLLDVLGLPAGDVDGLSLRDGPPPADRGVYFESFYGYYHYGWGPLAGWADARGKYVAGPRPRLYGPDDATEEQERAVDDAGEALVGAYRGAIAGVLAATPLPADESTPVDADLLEGVRALGYTASDAVRAGDDWPSPLEAEGLRDPHDGSQEVLDLNVAIHFGHELHDHERAVELLERILADNPRHAYALLELAFNLNNVQRYEESIAAIERFFALGWESAVAHLNVGTSYDKLGDPARALVHLRRAVELDPGYRQARAALVQVLEKRGLAEEASRQRALLDADRP